MGRREAPPAPLLVLFLGSKRRMCSLYPPPEGGIAGFCPLDLASTSQHTSNAMFCFNTKNKRHAVGNAELGLDKYKTVRDALLEQIAAEIEKTKGLELDIFNVGCHRKI
jgi:hypothetical protein